MNTSRSRKQVFNGGGALPLSYFNGGFDTQLTNDSGMDHNVATATVARPALAQTAGGNRENRQGGFYPTVMGPFAANAARLAVPLAAVAASQYLSAPPYFGRKVATVHKVAKSTKKAGRKTAKLSKKATRKGRKNARNARSARRN